MDIEIRKFFRVCAVPCAVFEQAQLSPGARLVLAWGLGQPRRGTFEEAQVCATLGLSESAWQSIRAELVADGWMATSRSSAGVETIALTDRPLVQQFAALAQRQGMPSPGSIHPAQGGQEKQQKTEATTSSPDVDVPPWEPDPSDLNAQPKPQPGAPAMNIPESSLRRLAEYLPRISEDKQEGYTYQFLRSEGLVQRTDASLLRQVIGQARRFVSPREEATPPQPQGRAALPADIAEWVDAHQGHVQFLRMGIQVEMHRESAQNIEERLRNRGYEKLAERLSKGYMRNIQSSRSTRSGNSSEKAGNELTVG